MADAFISRRGGGYATVKFENVSDLPQLCAVSHMKTARYGLAATTVGDYALFGGGADSSSLSTVDAYNTSLTRSTPTALSVARYGLAATTVGNYALFGGGKSSSYYSTVDAYNASLTRSTATALSEKRYDLAATTVGDYALFGGGFYNGDQRSTVDAYNASLTRSIPTALSEVRQNLAATTVGDYALFGGGYYKTNASGGVPTVTVDAYNASLIRNTLTTLSEERGELAATSLGGYAFFAGGNNDKRNPYSSAVVDIFDRGVIELIGFKGSKYKFQNMDEEVTVNSNMETIAIPAPATGYIKFKNTTIS